MGTRQSFERIGAAIRKRREAIGHSQESFADKIDMHRTDYSAIERREQNVTLETMKRICKGQGSKIWEVLKDAE